MSRRLVKSFIPTDSEIALLALRGREDDDDDTGNEDGADESENDSDEDENDDTEGDDKNPRVKELSDENARKRNQIKQLKADNEATQKRLKEFEDKDKSDKDKFEESATESNKKVESLTGENAKLRVENAFLAANTVTWHDPEMALAHIDLEDVVGDDGVVDRKALKKAVDDLAKAKPFLVKSTDEGDGKNPPPASGSKVGSPGQGSGKEKDREALMKKYPALRR